MGLDLILWPDEEPLTAEAALSRFEELIRAPAPSKFPAPASIQAFVLELDERWPPLEPDPDGRSPWSISRSFSDRHVVLSTLLSHRNLLTALNDVFDLAAQHGLAVFDPQQCEYVRADGSSSRAKQPETPELPELEDIPKEIRDQFEAKFMEQLKRDLAP